VTIQLDGLDPIVLESTLSIPIEATCDSVDGEGWNEVWEMLRAMDDEARLEIGKRRAGVHVLRQGISKYKESLDNAIEARRLVTPVIS
jgi:hypothetical protein